MIPSQSDISDKKLILSAQRDQANSVDVAEVADISICVVLAAPEPA
jgi:hypothetical protein